MTNTTTPAESIGAPSGAASFYRWEVPDKPISILLSLDLIDRLERDVIESFKAVTKRGSEIGGVLGGRVIGGSRPTVVVDQFEPVECDYSRGPLYLLSDEDKTKLRQAIERVRNSGNGVSITGFFRSNTRRELVLDEEDQALAQEFFSDPNHVFLLVRPFAMKPSAGGFFFWEDGQLHGEATYLQFPFKRAELLKSFAQFIVAAPEAPAAETPPAREPLVMPKREERPSAPPLTMKREEPKPAVTVPPRREEPLPPPPPVAKREEPKREEPVVPPPSFRREEPKPSVTVPPRREEPPAYQREERPPVVKRQGPPIILKRDERPPIVPVAPRHEERPAPPVSRREEPTKPIITPPPPPATAAPPVAPRKEERPAVPPVAVRREERPPLVVKREERPAPPPPVVKREEPAPAKPAEQPVAAKPPEVVVKPPEAVAKAPEVVVVAPPKKEEPAKAEPVKAEPPKPAPAAVAPAPEPERIERIPARVAEEPQPGLFSRLKWVIVAVLLVGVLGGGYYVYRSRGTATTVATKPADTSLGLKVETNAGQLLLSWNRKAPLIATATRGTLSIMDGDHKEDVDLDLGSLRSGSIVYSPMTNDVSFRLEVTDAKTGKSQAESVRRLAGRPSPAVAAATSPAQQPAPAKQTPATPERPVAQGQTTVAAAPPAESPQVVAGPAVTAAPPRPDTLAARLRAPEPQEIPAPPSLDTQSSALNARPPVAPVTGTMPAPPPAAAQPAAAAPRPAQPAAQAPRTTPPAAQAPEVRQGGRVQEARVIKRFPASYPTLARQMRITGIVRVHATVGKNGKVKKANAVSGPQMLRAAAVDAVMKWLYSPAILDGEPVESETQVDVNFTM
jgi:TonB family protein